MLNDKFSRHTVAFLTIAITSILLYLAAQLNNDPLAWFLLCMVALAALLTLTTK